MRKVAHFFSSTLTQRAPPLSLTPSSYFLRPPPLLLFYPRRLRLFRLPRAVTSCTRSFFRTKPSPTQFPSLPSTCPWRASNEAPDSSSSKKSPETPSKKSTALRTMIAKDCHHPHPPYPLRVLLPGVEKTAFRVSLKQRCSFVNGWTLHCSNDGFLLPHADLD